MKAIIILLLILSVIPLQIPAQSIVDLSSGTELEIGSNADVCADTQTGDGIITGPGTFCSGTLPVELTSFTSTLINREIILNWSTAEEINNRGFEVERNTMNGQWTKIGFVAGKGTVNIPQNYSYSDHNLNSGKYSYRLKQTDFNGNFEYFTLTDEVIVGVPVKFELSQNYPNPFNPSTKIGYAIPLDAKVNLKVFDITGKELASLINTYQPAGYYTVEINSSSISGGLTSGTYFYKINAQAG
ncbi:MAG TPA: T9SS type A sorting domain-containing protein, partial [Ignavibacteria bacterium]|nr:T9SS type A sorting domain-containing protein [Ignavibacteria bacterium]